MNIEEITLLVKEGEGLRVEFKERYSNKLDRDIVAFSNSKGGSLLLGVDDHGNVNGARLTNKLKAEIVDLARNCEPSITINSISQIGEVIVIDVPEGDEKPYACASGFYRRLDAVTQKLSQKEIKLLFQENVRVTHFEEQINGDVTWSNVSRDKIKAFFKEANISIEDFKVKEILSSLNLIRSSHITNAGILFFAKKPRDLILQCQMTLVAFKGTDRTQVYDRIDIQDDLLTQFNAARAFLRKHLNVRSEINAFKRTDIYEIPLDALREAIANAIIHRDYSMRGTSIMVEVHDDRVVISNPGGIPPGMDISSIINVSIRRNELIADIFARMDAAERLGFGLKRIKKIMDAAQQSYPEIESNLFFTVTFKRPFYVVPTAEAENKESLFGLDKPLDDTAKMILQKVEQDQNITAKQLAEKLNLSLRSIEKQLAKLKTLGILQRVGSRKTGYWQIRQ
ncbi:MAG: putative DNA binding domain-containing protein [Gammaproteobacteria bacterium]|nr:putative DNA binding domain-containing protein [Gammaproteobacteria bacterium]